MTKLPLPRRRLSHSRACAGAEAEPPSSGAGSTLPVLPPAPVSGRRAPVLAWASAVGAVTLSGVALARTALFGPIPLLPACGLWGAELALVLATGAYARRVVDAADSQSRRHDADLARLAQTNLLLADLCRVAGGAALPADPITCARAAAADLRRMFEPDVMAVVALHEGGLGPGGEVLLAEGAALPASVTRSDLPPRLWEAAAGSRGVVVDLGDGGGGPGGGGLGAQSRSGLYVPLRVGTRLIGVLALESTRTGRWTGRELTVAEAVGARMALTIDNARRFSLLCLTGLTEERTRIAGELHDRIGQAVAAVGLTLDGIIRQVDRTLARDDAAGEVADELRLARQAVRSVVADLRGTVSDLRCQVSESLDLGSALQRLARRYTERPVVTVTTGEVDRLDLERERQLYLLAGEAVASAAAAGARHVSVCWFNEDGSPLLEVIDDAPVPPAPSGRFPGSGINRPASVETMRARCEAAHGRFHMTRTRRGTVLRCSM